MEFLHFLVYPFVVLINMSFEEGVFPSLNKDADFCPIFKTIDRNKCENYRPISNISKIFERVMYTCLENSLSILYRFQFGIRKGFSTNHALLSIVERIRSAIKCSHAGSLLTLKRLSTQYIILLMILISYIHARL